MSLPSQREESPQASVRRSDDKGRDKDEQAELLVTSASAGKGENELCIELDYDSDLTSESVKDCPVHGAAEKGACGRCYWWFSGAPGSPEHYYMNKEMMFLGISFVCNEKKEWLPVAE